MSDAPAIPRDDRALPQGAFGFSVACGLAALAGSAAMVATATSLHQAFGLALVFVTVAGLEAAVYVGALRLWWQGRPVPTHTQVLQVALVALTLVAFVGGPRMGGEALCGLVAGVFLPSASAIRYARVRRSLEEEGEPELGREEPGVSSEGHPGRQPAGRVGVERQVRARALPKVGPVLREAVLTDRDRSLAWAGATVAVGIGCVEARTAAQVLLGVILLGTVAATWVARRMLGTRLALRDFEQAAVAPRRGYVVFLQDPNPRVRQPLLGAWSAEPVPVGGRLPRAEAVYRCARERDALVSSPGAVVVHEAWLDAGPRGRAMPRWVAAEAGIALPQRRAVLGRRHLASVVATERPARTRQLTMPAPNPTTEAETGTVRTVISEPTPGNGPWLRLLAWRFVVLAVVGLLLTRWG